MAVFEKAAALERLNRPFALASIVSSRGVVPRRSGRMLFAKDGEREGTLGGHRIEEEVAREAAICLEEGRGRRVTVAAGHGEVDIMIDPVNTARCAIIIGHVISQFDSRTISSEVHCENMRISAFSAGGAFGTSFCENTDPFIPSACSVFVLITASVIASSVALEIVFWCSAFSMTPIWSEVTCPQPTISAMYMADLSVKSLHPMFTIRIDGFDWRRWEMTWSP